MQCIPHKRHCDHAAEKQYSYILVAIKKRFDMPLGKKQKNDQCHQDKILHKGFKGGQFDTITKTTAFLYLIGEYGITRKECEKQNE